MTFTGVRHSAHATTGGTVGPADSLRVGIVGAGLIGPWHADAIGKTSGVQLRAVCDTDLDRARQLAEPVGARAFGGWRAMLEGDVVDAVVIAVPHAAHAEVAAGFGSAGVHVLLEKPMATTLAGCDEVIAACDSGRAVLAVAHLQRFLPRNVAARERIASGEFGNPQFIVDRRTSQYEANSRPSWFFDGVASGGGIVMNVGIHCIDRVHYLAGGRTVRVSASTRIPPGASVETEAAMLLELDTGVSTVVALTGTGGLQVDRTEVVCSSGAIVIEHDIAGAFRRPEEAGGAEAAHPADHVGAAFASQFADFVAAIREGRAPAADGTEGRAALATVLAAYQSASTGQPAQVLSANPYQ